MTPTIDLVYHKLRAGNTLTKKETDRYIRHLEMLVRRLQDELNATRDGMAELADGIDFGNDDLLP